MFVDKITIKVQGGDGGNGCMSFRREKFVPFGGPNGGDGGKGGDVVLVADPGEQSLVYMVYKRHHRGDRGEHGRGSDQHGKGGKDKILRVPIGTIVKDIDNDLEVITDMDEPGKRFILARGGKGGKGNMRFATSTNKAPREHEPGTPGELVQIELELKSIANVGFVGYPNAGKSTLLGALSAAKPKVAPYPFTTLHPVVGTVDYPDYYRMSIADIPGLIDGAHDNIGLGHDFLRHIERTTVLAYVLDMAGVDGRTPYDDYLSLKNELELYLEGLSDRAVVIFANKMDLPESEENLKELQKVLGGKIQIVPISASESINIDVVLDMLRKSVEEKKKEAELEKVASE